MKNTSTICHLGETHGQYGCFVHCALPILLEGCDLLIVLGSLFLDRMYVIQCVEFIDAYGFDVKLDCE